MRRLGHLATVRRRGWLSRDRFLDLVGATNLIPGPNSTEMTMHLGYERGGFAGLLVAGACFIAPAAALTGVLAWAYVEYGALPSIQIAGKLPSSNAFASRFRRETL